MKRKVQLVALATISFILAFTVETQQQSFGQSQQTSKSDTGNTQKTTSLTQTHKGVQITLASVERMKRWSDPRFKNFPGGGPGINAGEGFEVAVVTLKAKVLEKGAKLPVKKTWIVDIKEEKHESPMVGSDDLGEDSNEETREIPIVVPQGRELKVFHLSEAIWFDLTKVKSDK